MYITSFIKLTIFNSTAEMKTNAFLNVINFVIFFHQPKASQFQIEKKIIKKN